MADFAVAEALEKYGLEKENPRDYCIAQVRFNTVLTFRGNAFRDFPMINLMVQHRQCFKNLQDGCNIIFNFTDVDKIIEFGY